MKTDEKFNADEAAEMAKQLARLEAAVIELREAERRASEARNSAECKPANLRSAFTRLVQRHLDPHVLSSARPDGMRVPAPAASEHA